MPGKSLNEGTDTWNGKQPLRRIKKRILSRRTTRKTGKGIPRMAIQKYRKREVLYAGEGEGSGVTQSRKRPDN